MGEDKNLQDEIKQGEADGESEMSLSEVCRFIIFSVLFVAIILNQISTEKCYHISAGISQALSSCDPSEVTSAKDVISWIGESFLPAVSGSEIYPGWSAEAEDYLRVNLMNRIITPLRFVQKRMKTTENTNSRTKSLVKRKWVANYLEPYKSNSDEDRSEFRPAHIYEDGKNISDINLYLTEKYKMYKYDSSIGVDSSGGFTYEVLINDTTKVDEAILFFKDTPWIDNVTAIIYVDFVTYNSHYAMLTYVNYLFTFQSSGIVEGKFEIRSTHFDKYTANDTVRIIFEALYLLLLLFYTIIEIQEIKMDVLSESIRLQGESEQIKCIKIVMFLKGLQKHLSDLWNVLDIASILLSYIGLGLWVDISNNKIMQKDSLVYDPELTDDVLNIIFTSKIYVKINSVNLLLIFFRLLKYLGKFERIRLLHQTFVTAKTEIFYFFILLIGIFLSFVIFGHVAFGGIHEQFSSLGLAFASCLIILFTNMDTINELLDLNFNMTALFIVLFTLFINFILANMFIAIINNAYATELDRLEALKAGIKEPEQVHWIFQMRDWFKKLKLSILSFFSKKKAVINKYADREQEIAKLDEEDEIIRAKNYNLDFNDAMKWGEKFDKEILTDKERNAKMKAQTFNFSKRVWKATIFIVFAIIYTVVLLNQMEISTKYDLNFTVQGEINGASSADGIDLSSVGTYSDFASWLNVAFSDMFTLTAFYNMQGNYLVGQNLNQKDTCSSQGSIRMTLRYVKYEDNPSNLFHSVNPIRRKGEFSPYPSITSFSLYEDTNIVLDNSFPCKFTHTSFGDGGFAEQGGFIFYFSQDPLNYTNQISKLLTKSLFLNETTNSIVFDFVLYNGDLNYFTYVAFVAQTLSGGEIYSTYYLWPMKLKMYFTASDKVRAFFEVVIVLLLGYHIFVTVTTLKNKFKCYDDWSSRFNEILTTNQKEKRKTAKPEVLRKISSILTSYEIIDITSYFISIICLIYWLVYISTDLAVNFKLPTEDTDFHDKFSKQAEILQTYLNLSSFNILLIYFRIMNYVAISKALSFLQDTMKEAMVDIIYFLIMLVVILMGFVFMGYLSFGHTLSHYKTIQDSFITCFAMMIGEFDYSELLTADDSMAYFFFFFYMLFFTFILLNIFIAILERAYTKVKMDTGNEEANVTVFQSLLIFIINSFKNIIKKNKTEQEHQKDIKELAICVFNRIESGVEEEEDPVSWAIKQTEEILLERQKRSEIKAPLDAIFRMRKQNVIEGGNFFFEKDDDLLKEFQTRIDYWDYLRIGFLSFQTQEQRIRLKTEEMIKKNNTLYEEYKDIEAAKEDIILDIQPFEQQLLKLKKENDELRKKLKELDE